METIRSQCLIHFLRYPIEAREDPAVFESRGLKSRDARRRHRMLDGTKSRIHAVDIHEHEARCIPYLVSEGAITICAALAECNVGARRGHGGQRETRGVGTEAQNDIQRIDHVALGL